MRANYIYETFKENSDPIEDMNIGIKGLSAYDEVWVVIAYGHVDISEVFLNKTKAQRAADKNNKDIYDYSRKLHSHLSDKEFADYEKKIQRRKYEVVSLYDAIEMIKEVIRDTIRDYE